MEIFLLLNFRFKGSSDPEFRKLFGSRTRNSTSALDRILSRNRSRGTTTGEATTEPTNRLRAKQAAKEAFRSRFRATTSSPFDLVRKVLFFRKCNSTY